MEDNNTNLPNQEDYYSKTSRRVMDFLVGYIGFFAFLFAIYYLLFLFPVVFAAIISLSFPLFLALIVAAVVIVNNKLKEKRRYIAKGVNFAVLTLIIVPILFFGACFVSMISYNAGGRP